MKFSTQGKDVSEIEVLNISKHGIWLATRDHELFISFEKFPWFQDASVRKLMNVEQRTPTCLHWPDLAIDLAIESVRCFPLLSQTSRPTTRSSRQAKTEPITQLKSDQRSDPLRTSPKV
ncbi:MAG: DUF2442 domain-containing protein [Nitrospira sp.]|nr:MAG: DUF2442 domain-containing protein [Nitrospira sp.]